MASSGGRGGSGALTLIESQTLTGAAASVTFSGIVQTYKDLLITFDGRSTTAAASLDTLLAQFNGDTAANYDYINDGVESFGQTAIRCGLLVQASAPAGLSAAGEILILNYAGTAFNKTLNAVVSSKIGVAAGNLRNEKNAGFWRSSAAVTSILLKPGANSFAIGCVFNLYGRA